MYPIYTKSRPDRFWCTYARWDGRFNGPTTLLCWRLLKLGRKDYSRCFSIFLHPIWQYPFGFCSGISLDMYLWDLRIFWIQFSLRWSKW